MEANFQPLHPQISALTEMINWLIQVFFIYGGLVVSEVQKFLSSTSELEFWLDEIGKVLLVLRYPNLPAFLFGKLHIWNFYYGLIWRWYIFKSLSDEIFTNFVPSFGKLKSLKCENVD